MAFVDKPLRSVTLHDLQAFSDALVAAGLSPASRHRKLTAAKSLFGFGVRLGYLRLDPSKPLRLSAVVETLGSRILPEPDLLAMIRAERQPRNHVLLLVAYATYATGARVSELAGLTWHRVVARDGGLGQVTVLGKGSKTGSILLPASVFAALSRMRPEVCNNDGPVFRSRLGGAMSTGQMLRVVKAAAKRVGLSRNVVMHTLRDCHCSHALDRGAPVSLVSASAGHASVATTGRYLHARPNDSSGRFLVLS